MIRVEHPAPGQPKIIFESKEEWKNWLRSMAGSITDETFVEPEDHYVLENVAHA